MYIYTKMSCVTFENCIINNMTETNTFKKLLKESSRFRRDFVEIESISKERKCSLKEAYFIYYGPPKKTVFVIDYKNNGYFDVGGGYFHPSCSHGAITYDSRYSICG